ncbi:MAG TPA: SGNH/GDSL hydrolase family protein [Bacteroidetes bacterium]|nr:SGNH/GDSL hydrolase family protein [Bacteroidota bacterium]
MFRKTLFFLITVLLFSLVVIAIGEVATRLFLPKPVIEPPENTALKDDELGWKMTPNYSFKGTLKDRDGAAYEDSISYDENGFKAFGDTASARPKILFLGDSYTASRQVSNNKSFFKIIGDSLGAEIFAYGHPGYGTLQEYMIFDKWVGKIKPDVVVWQVCSNDFIDNYAGLEMVCGYGVGERRPYLNEQGEIYYKRPLTLFQKIQEHIWFFKWLDSRWDNLLAKVKKEDIKVGEYYIANDKRDFEPFDKSVIITEKIVKKIKERLPKNTKLTAFTSDMYQPQRSEFRRIFESNGFTFLEKPAQAVQKAEYQKMVVKAADGYHWNMKGHELVANSLLPELKKLLEN